MNIHWKIGERRPNFTPICHIHTINVFIKLTGTYRQILHDNCGSTVKFYHLLEHIILKKEKNNILKNLIFCPIWIEIWRFVQWTKMNKTDDHYEQNKPIMNNVNSLWPLRVCALCTFARHKIIVNKKEWTVARLRAIKL